MKTKACRLSFDGERYQINADGSVQIIAPLSIDGFLPVDEFVASKVKAEARRLRHNRSQRERNQAMRDLGLVKTPYGWE